jgi:hypothetical protein
MKSRLLMFQSLLYAISAAARSDAPELQCAMGKIDGKKKKANEINSSPL